MSSAEAKQPLLGDHVGHMRERSEDQRMHNIELGNMLAATLNAVVASLQELTGVVREGMASQAKVARVSVAIEK